MIIASKECYPWLERAMLTIPLGYWAFLDFALAAIPIDIVWKLQMSFKQKFMLSCLLGMGVL